MLSSSQQDQWDFLCKRRQKNNLPHALLLTGLHDLEFPITFAKSLLCSANNQHGHACGNCHSCQLIHAGSHPDFYQIAPEEAGKTIRIDQIRELIAQLNQTAQQGCYKVAVIAPAEAMQVGAVNALLKTLEEPTANTLIMLVTNQPSLLAATIRSRCQRLSFCMPEIPLAPERNERQQRLIEGLTKLSDDKTDPVQFAATWSKEPLNEVVLGLMNAIAMRIRAKLDAPLLAKPALVKLFSYLDELYKIRQTLNLAINLNQQLVLEDLFITWHEHTRYPANS